MAPTIPARRRERMYGEERPLRPRRETQRGQTAHSRARRADENFNTLTWHWTRPTADPHWSDATAGTFPLKPAMYSVPWSRTKSTQSTSTVKVPVWDVVGEAYPRGGLADDLVEGCAPLTSVPTLLMLSQPAVLSSEPDHRCCDTCSLHVHLLGMRPAAWKCDCLRCRQPEPVIRCAGRRPRVEASFLGRPHPCQRGRRCERAPRRRAPEVADALAHE